MMHSIKISANRPKERNGYGFVSSWWNENSDENVYYTINLDETTLLIRHHI